MSQNYEPEFKKKIVRLHLEEGQSLKWLAAEYGVSKYMNTEMQLFSIERVGTASTTDITAASCKLTAT